MLEREGAYRQRPFSAVRRFRSPCQALGGIETDGRVRGLIGRARVRAAGYGGVCCQASGRRVVESYCSLSSRGENEGVSAQSGWRPGEVRMTYPETGQHVLRLYSDCSRVHARGGSEAYTVMKVDWRKWVVSAAWCPVICCSATRPQPVERMAG